MHTANGILASFFTDMDLGNTVEVINTFPWEFNLVHSYSLSKKTFSSIFIGDYASIWTWGDDYVMPCYFSRIFLWIFINDKIKIYKLMNILRKNKDLFPPYMVDGIDLLSVSRRMYLQYSESFNALIISIIFINYIFFCRYLIKQYWKWRG